MQDQERRRGERRVEGRDRLLTDGQMALMAGVPASTIRYWRHIGLVPCVKVGRHPRVWLSVFLGIYQKPGVVGIETAGTRATMSLGKDVRRAS